MVNKPFIRRFIYTPGAEPRIAPARPQILFPLGERPAPIQGWNPSPGLGAADLLAINLNS